MGHTGETRTEAGANEGMWTFHVFVVGRAAPHSRRAVLNLRRVLDLYLSGRYELEVFDLEEKPELAAKERLIVIPTVVRRHPDPPVRLTGDFSNEPRVVAAFGLGPPVEGLADRER